MAVVDNGLDIVTLVDIHNNGNKYDMAVGGQTSYILNNRSGAPIAVYLYQERASTPVLKVVEAYSETVYSGTKPITDVVLINLTDSPLPQNLSLFKSSPPVLSGLFFVSATNDDISIVTDIIPPGYSNPLTVTPSGTFPVSASGSFPVTASGSYLSTGNPRTTLVDAGTQGPTGTLVHNIYQLDPAWGAIAVTFGFTQNYNQSVKVTTYHPAGPADSPAFGSNYTALTVPGSQGDTLAVYNPVPPPSSVDVFAILTKDNFIDVQVTAGPATPTGGIYDTGIYLVALNGNYPPQQVIPGNSSTSTSTAYTPAPYNVVNVGVPFNLPANIYGVLGYVLTTLVMGVGGSAALVGYLFLKGVTSGKLYAIASYEAHLEPSSAAATYPIAAQLTPGEFSFPLNCAAIWPNDNQLQAVLSFAGYNSSTSITTAPTSISYTLQT